MLGLVYRLLTKPYLRGPLPNPLPEGEGTIQRDPLFQRAREQFKEIPSPSGRGLGRGPSARKSILITDNFLGH
jgi:hypothetical protein